MRKIDQLPDKEYILGNLLIVANKLDKILDRELKIFDITSKQFLMSAIIDTLFEEPPTLKKLACEMGSSHQNIKQVALKLEKKGLIEFEKDDNDRRVTRIRMSEDGYEFWESTHQKGHQFTESTFAGINQAELQNFRMTLEKIMININEME